MQVYFSAAMLLLLPWFWQPPLLPRKIFWAVVLQSVPSLQSVLNVDSRQSPTKWRYEYARPQVRLFTRERHLQNGSVRSSQNLLFQRSKENTEENVKINIFRTLEINQRLETIQMFIQEKWLPLSKTNGPCHILTCPIPVSLSPAPNQQHCDREELWKPADWQSSCGEVCVWSSPKALSSEHCHYLTCTAAPWTSLLLGACLYLIWLRACSVRYFICRAFVKNSQNNCLTLPLPDVA